MKKLTRDQLVRARDAVAKLREQMLLGVAEQEARWKGENFDESYAQSLQALRDPGLETGLEGKAELGKLT